MLRRVSFLILLVCGLVAGAATAEAANITVAWDPAAGATGYVILYGTQTNVYTNQVDAGNVSQYTISGLTAGSTYYISVRSYNLAGSSPNLVEVFGVASNPTTPPPPPPPTSSDLNGDGFPDLLWQQQATGQLAAWYMQGTTMQTVKLFTPSTVSDPLWKVVGVGDFDADGQNDLVLQHATTRQIVVWLMTGTTLKTVVTPPNTVGLSTVWKVAGVADFNGDGKADILFRNTSTGQLNVWNMQGTTLGSITTLSMGVADQSWSIVGIADFNGDGQKDLLWQSNTTGLLALWYLQGANVSSTTLTNPSTVSDTSWKVAGVGDFNSDGHPDIFWQNITSGLIGVWYMNNATQTGVKMIAPATVDPIWRIVTIR